MYSLNEFGHFSYGEDLDAEDDREAVALAQELSGRAKICELWQERRLVATLKAGDFVATAV
jgi:hypothetical protein